MDAARVASLGPAKEGFGDAERFNVADHRAGIDEMEADGGVGKLLALFHVDHVGCGRKEAAGLALQCQVLSFELQGGEHGNREEAANNEFVDGAKIHLDLTPVEGS